MTASATSPARGTPRDRRQSKHVDRREEHQRQHRDRQRDQQVLRIADEERSSNPASASVRRPAPGARRRPCRRSARSSPSPRSPGTRPRAVRRWRRGGVRWWGHGGGGVGGGPGAGAAGRRAAAWREEVVGVRGGGGTAAGAGSAGFRHGCCGLVRAGGRLGELRSAARRGRWGGAAAGPKARRVRRGRPPRGPPVPRVTRSSGTSSATNQAGTVAIGARRLSPWRGGASGLRRRGHAVPTAAARAARRSRPARSRSRRRRHGRRSGPQGGS